MRFLITGTTGFVAPHLINLLHREGHTAVAMYRNGTGNHLSIEDIVTDIDRVQFIPGDLLSADSIAKVFQCDEYDGVFHLAAQSHPPTSFTDPALTFETNAVGTMRLVNTMMYYQPHTPLLNCSTSEVYGICPEEPINESMPLAPINPYGVSKAAADMYIHERSRNTGLNALNTRAFSHTGPRRGKIFSIASDAYQIARIIRGVQDPVIRVGNLESRRVVMDVRDCVEAYYKLMRRMKRGLIGRGESYNVGGDDLHSMRFFLDMMLEQRGLKDNVELEVSPLLYRKIDIPVQYPDSTLVRETTDWMPTIPIEETLYDLVEYFLEKE
jgi:GDPmannose 4,6-dehydratase